MIFCSKNEKGELASDLVNRGLKTVTRRTKPQPVGAIRSVQPNRGKKSVCKIQIVSCIKEEKLGRLIFDEVKRLVFGVSQNAPFKYMEIFFSELERSLDLEANREGFESWNGLATWFNVHYKTIPSPLYRIEFCKINESNTLAHKDNLGTKNHSKKRKNKRKLKY